jgi:hypothetical protein
VAVVALPAGWSPAEERKYHGDGRDILLQGFHWDSHTGAQEPGKGKKSWYRILKENAGTIKAAGVHLGVVPAGVGLAGPAGVHPAAVEPP